MPAYRKPFEIKLRVAFGTADCTCYSNFLEEANMKKIMTMMLAGAVSLSLGACTGDSGNTGETAAQNQENTETAAGNEDADGTEGTENAGEYEASEGAEESAASTEAEDTQAVAGTDGSDIDRELLPGEFQIPLMPLGVYTPSPNKYKQLEKSTTELFLRIPDGNEMVGVTDLSIGELPEGGVEDYVDKFLWNVQNYFHLHDDSTFRQTGHLEEANYSVAETVEINGIEAYYYEGTIDCREYSDSYIVGYSFIFEDVPCNITGFNVDPEQTDEDREKLKAKTKKINYEITALITGQP